MNYKKLKLVVFTSIIFTSFAITTASAGSTLIKAGKSKNALSSLTARSLAVKKFGRKITILSNRKLTLSGCRRISIRTSAGKKETLKICK